MIRSQAANLLSASRIALAALWLLAFSSANRGPAILGTIAIAAAASDLIDGRLARRLGVAGGVGRWLDSVADIIFILVALGCEAWGGALPAYIPILIAVSFSQYMIDSILIGRLRTPIRSRLGHWGGIINFALVIVLAFAPPPAWPGAIVLRLSPLLAIYYVAAIAERAARYPSAFRN